MSMRLVFMGTAELACPCLEAVAALPGQQLLAVVTQPDRPKGRALQLQPPPVKVTAQRLGLPVQQPERIRDPAALAALQLLRPELMIVVAYGQILPLALLELPAAGCINVHASLLPRWRGAAPIQYAILHGDDQTGVSTMFLTERLDPGDVILQRVEPILPGDTAGVLHERLAHLGARLLVETLARLEQGTAPRLPQAEGEVTLAPKIEKDQGRINWDWGAVAIERMIRAFNPWPSAQTDWGGEPIKVWEADVVPAVAGVPGTVAEQHVIVTGAGGLRLREVQPAGKRRMPFAAFLRGHPLPIGTRLVSRG